MTDETVLNRAVVLGEVLAAREIIERAPQLLTVRIINKSWLHWAAQSDQLEIAKVLVEAGMPIDEVTSDGASTALEIAAGQGYLEMCRWLLDQGADVNRNLGQGATPIFDAVYGGNLELVQLFIDRGADLSATFGNPLSGVLSFARAHGSPEIVQFLRERGAN